MYWLDTMKEKRESVMIAGVKARERERNASFSLPASGRGGEREREKC